MQSLAPQPTSSHPISRPDWPALEPNRWAWRPALGNCFIKSLLRGGGHPFVQVRVRKPRPCPKSPFQDPRACTCTDTLQLKNAVRGARSSLERMASLWGSPRSQGSAWSRFRQMIKPRTGLAHLAHNPLFLSMLGRSLWVQFTRSRTFACEIDETDNTGGRSHLANLSCSIQCGCVRPPQLAKILRQLLSGGRAGDAMRLGFVMAYLPSRNKKKKRRASGGRGSHMLGTGYT